MNDILEGCRNVVAKVEEYKASKFFELISELCGWLTYEFRYQVEVALIMFVATREKTYMNWVKTKKRIGRI